MFFYTPLLVAMSVSLAWLLEFHKPNAHARSHTPLIPGPPPHASPTTKVLSLGLVGFK